MASRHIKEKLKKLKNLIVASPFSPLFKVFYDCFNLVIYRLLLLKYWFKGYKKPTKEQADEVVKNVTFIYKSFERQNMSIRLYRSIQKYYPGAEVIIADDSQKPLKLKDKHLRVIQLPFNKGLSYGLNRSLKMVETPFTMRLDEDMLLTPFSKIYEQLLFLTNHPEVDLSSIQLCNPSLNPSPKREAERFLKFTMKNAAKPLIIPHKTQIDDTHYVFAKTSNTFLIRTKKYKSLGYDDNIRMIDHHEFFMRAAGVIVSATDISAFVFHYHNPFDKNYNRYRSDFLADKIYIKKKHKL